MGLVNMGGKKVTPFQKRVNQKPAASQPASRGMDVPGPSTVSRPKDRPLVEWSASAQPTKLPPGIKGNANLNSKQFPTPSQGLKGALTRVRTATRLSNLLKRF
jgi:hypothetical protein